MKLNKVLGTYLMDLGELIAGESEPLCPQFLTDLFMVLNKFELKKEEKKLDFDEKEEPVKTIEHHTEEMSPEECLACELANMLGIAGDDMFSPGEHVMAHKPTIKIKIKKVSSKDDLNKILKELKTGGVVDLNTMNDSLGEIFDLNSIQEIMETPMFKQGGLIETPEETVESFLNEL